MASFRQTYKAFRNVFLHPGAGDGVTAARLLRNALSYYLRSDGRAAPPLTIYIGVNSRCNLKCKMCDLGQHRTDSSFFKNLSPEGRPEMELKDLKTLIDEVARFKPFISIVASEPLLYPDLLEACEYILRKGLAVSVTTNGFLLEKFAEDFVRIGLTRLNVSLDGPPEVHDALRGVPGSFEKASLGIRRLIEARRAAGRQRPHVHLLYTITNKNAHCLEAFMEAITPLNVDHVVFYYMNFVTAEMAARQNSQFQQVGLATVTTLSDEINPGETDTETLVRQIAAVKESYPRLAHFSPDLDPPAVHKYFHEPDAVVWDRACLIPWFVSEISPSGEVVPLTRCMNIRLGNIHESDFSSIWNGEAMRLFRLDLKRNKSFPVCSRCCGIL